MQSEPRAPLRNFLNGIGAEIDPIPTAISKPAPASDDIVDMLERALAFDMSLVRRRYVREYGVSESEAREHELELKRYLVLCAKSKAPYSVSTPIDYLWHTFILFTKPYTAFCELVAGRYIHHFPSEEGNESAKANLAAYAAMLDVYRDTFGIEPPSHIWPRFDHNAQMHMEPCTYCSG